MVPPALVLPLVATRTSVRTMLGSRPSLRTASLAIGAGLLGVLLAAIPASAHVGQPDEGILEGLLHPLTGPDHLLAMLAVGIVAVVATPRPGVWPVPLGFLGGMVLGGIAGMAGVPLPGAETLIVASVLLLGLAVAGAVQGAGLWVVAVIAAAGLVHGHAHGAEAPTSAHPLAYVGGFLIATASLHLAGIGAGQIIRDRRTIRVGLGAATVAASAVLFAG